MLGYIEQFKKMEEDIDEKEMVAYKSSISDLPKEFC